MKIAGDEDAIRERFATSLSFGTARLHKTLGVGTNRMNTQVVRQATQGIADWVKTESGSQMVAINYDDRLKSWNFARGVASVFAADGIQVRLHDEFISVPAFLLATRYYSRNAGIMITASHSPAKYNGYKVYGVDDCQVTDEDAAIVYAAIQKTDVLGDAKLMNFAEGVERGLIRFVDDNCKEAFYAMVKSRQVRSGICKTAGLGLVCSPLNGTGLIPVTHVLKDVDVEDVMIVKEQEYPNGYFTTCPYPNPEISEALAKELTPVGGAGANLMLATDPGADRIGIAVRAPDGGYELVSGNEMGVLLLGCITAGRREAGTVPERPAVVESVVSTQLTDEVAEHYGIELRSVLVGFKRIGDQVHRLESENEAGRFIFGFEKSYGCLASTYVRDKDAVAASMLTCETAAYYWSIGSPIRACLGEIYRTYNHYLNAVNSFEFPGLSGTEKISGIAEAFRKDPPKELVGYAVTKVMDFEQAETTGLSRANVLLFALGNGETIIVHPSGTEPKIEAYFTTRGKGMDEAEKEKEKLTAVMKPLFI